MSFKDVTVQSDLFSPLVIYFHLLSLPFRFLYDKSTLEYLYYKKRVAVLRNNLRRPETASDNGKYCI